MESEFAKIALLVGFYTGSIMEETVAKSSLRKINLLKKKKGYKNNKMLYLRQ